MPTIVGRVIQHDLDREVLRQLTGESWEQPFVLSDHDGPTLATGAVFISDPLMRKRLAERAALVDMEAYALAAVANQAGVPMRVVKHVTDSASERSAQSWRAAMAGSALALAEWIESNLVAHPRPAGCAGADSLIPSADRHPR